MKHPGPIEEERKISAHLLSGGPPKISLHLTATESSEQPIDLPLNPFETGGQILEEHAPPLAPPNEKK